MLLFNQTGKFDKILLLLGSRPLYLDRHSGVTFIYMYINRRLLFQISLQSHSMHNFTMVVYLFNNLWSAEETKRFWLLPILMFSNYLGHLFTAALDPSLQFLQYSGDIL